MTERVIWIDDAREDAGGNHPCDLREEVVRCRDCSHWRRPSSRDRSRCTGAMAFVEPTPGGFCAWAERKQPGDSPRHLEEAEASEGIVREDARR